MPRSIKNRKTLVRRLESRATDLDGLTLGLLLLAGVHNVCKEPTLTILVLGLLLVLLDGSIVNAAAKKQNLPASCRLASIDVADENYVHVQSRVGLFQVALLNLDFR